MDWKETITYYCEGWAMPITYDDDVFFRLNKEMFDYCDKFDGTVVLAPTAEIA